jgi:branched-chain amino acid transport system permease protein
MTGASPAARTQDPDVQLPPLPQGGGLPRVVRVAAVMVVAAVLIIYPHVLTGQFWWEIGILAMIFATAAAGWNVLGGYAGQISFGHAVFFGAGAYTTALAVRAGWSPWLSIPLGAVVAAAIGLTIGVPCLRLRSHYFAIATIAVGEIAYIVVNSNKGLGSSAGLTIPLHAQTLANLQFSVRNPTPYYNVALVLFAAATGFVYLFLRGRTGSYLKAIRDDQEAAAAAGINLWRYKLVAVSISAVLTAVPGSLYAMYVLFVDPSLVLDLTVSINIVLITMLGGIGTLWGPLIGAWAVEALDQYTQQQFGSVAGLDLLIFGLVIVIVVLIEPGGIAALLTRGWKAAIRARHALADRYRSPREASDG